MKWSRITDAIGKLASYLHSAGSEVLWIQRCHKQEGFLAFLCTSHQLVWCMLSCYVTSPSRTVSHGDVMSVWPTRQGLGLRWFGPSKLLVRHWVHISLQIWIMQMLSITLSEILFYPILFQFSFFLKNIPNYFFFKSELNKCCFGLQANDIFNNVPHRHLSFSQPVINGWDKPFHGTLILQSVA